MIDQDSYFAQTENAMRSLFRCLNEYRDIAKLSVPPIYVDDGITYANINARYVAWRTNHSIEEAHELATYAFEEYQAHAFSVAVITGSILQIASKAIDLFGRNTDLNADAEALFAGLNFNNKFSKYAAGRSIRGVPLGLIIYAGRNQYNHIELGANLNNVNSRVFEGLATNHGYGNVVDPAFDLHNNSIDSYSANIVALIEWDDYEDYLADIVEILC